MYILYMSFINVLNVTPAVRDGVFFLSRKLSLCNRTTGNKIIQTKRDGDGVMLLYYIKLSAGSRFF